MVDRAKRFRGAFDGCYVTPGCNLLPLRFRAHTPAETRWLPTGSFSIPLFEMFFSIYPMPRRDSFERLIELSVRDCLTLYGILMA
jgi:hypothetical protein